MSWVVKALPTLKCYTRMKLLVLTNSLAYDFVKVIIAINVSILQIPIVN